MMKYGKLKISISSLMYEFALNRIPDLSKSRRLNEVLSDKLVFSKDILRVVYALDKNKSNKENKNE